MRSLKAEIAVPADDDVIDHIDFHDFGRIQQLLGNGKIFFTRLCVPGGMVMDNYDTCCPVADRIRKYLAWMADALV